MNDAEHDYYAALEQLFTDIKDMIYGERLTQADVPDDWYALVVRVGACEEAKERVDNA